MARSWLYSRRSLRCTSDVAILVVARAELILAMRRLQLHFYLENHSTYLEYNCIVPVLPPKVQLQLFLFNDLQFARTRTMARMTDLDLCHVWALRQARLMIRGANRFTTGSDQRTVAVCISVHVLA